MQPPQHTRSHASQSPAGPLPALRFLISAAPGPERSTLLASLLRDGVSEDLAPGHGAWRCLRSARREFIMAAAPATDRDLAGAASRCDLALILLDAQHGVTAQVRHDAALVHLMGVGRLVVAINTMDLARFDRQIHAAICNELLAFAKLLGAGEPEFIPVCTAHGDNVAVRSANMPWYEGPTLLDFLETVDAITADGDAVSGVAAATVQTDRVEASLLWLGDEPLLAGRRYELRTGAAAVPATVNRLIQRLNLVTLASDPAAHLEKDDIGRCDVLTEQPVTCSKSLRPARFTLLDRHSQVTLAIGTLTAHETRRLFWERVSVDKSVRAAAKEQRPRVVWFTGLSGAGKSTLANAVEEALFREGLHTYLVDGDNVRHGLSKDLGFGIEDRIENTRRVGELAKLMADAGLIVLVSLISPFRAERRMVRELLEPGEFVEVHVSTPLAVCESRDRKGLYRMARAGTLKEFTGISSPYEPPDAAEIVADTSAEPLESCVRRIVALVRGTR